GCRDRPQLGQAKQGHGDRELHALRRRRLLRLRSDQEEGRHRLEFPGAGDVLERNDFSSNRHFALAFCLSMIFSENRYTLFRIMLYSVSCFCPQFLQTNFARVSPLAACTRLGAPHLPQTASIRVLPCLTTTVFFSIASRIMRS